MSQRDFDKVCATCRFCTELEDPDHGNPDLGLCRRRAPIALAPAQTEVLTHRGRVPVPRVLAVFPIVFKATMYCFEHEARPTVLGECPNVLPGAECMLRQGHEGKHSPNGDGEDDGAPRCGSMAGGLRCQLRGDHGNRHESDGWRWRGLLNR